MDLYGPVPHNTIFTKSYKTRDFEHLWPFSWAIVHGFGVRLGFIWSGTPSHDFNKIIRNSWFRAFLPIFVGYSTRFWARRGFNWSGNSSPDFLGIIKTRDFGHFWPFSWDIAHGFGPDEDLYGPGPVTRFSQNHKNSWFRAFLCVFVGYSTRFWGPMWIYMIRDPSHNFHEIIKNSWFRAFLTVFVGYSTRFWGSTWIYMVLDPFTRF